MPSSERLPARWPRTGGECRCRRGVGAGVRCRDDRGNRYVQGGGCTTVGVAGLIQSGGFGSFSKNYGTAAAGLLEAEIVTADGRVRIVNACSDPELFWAPQGRRRRQLRRGHARHAADARAAGKLRRA